MSVGYRTMSMAEMSTILRNLQRSLESLQSQINSLSGGGGGIGGGATSHNLLSTTHSDTEADTVVQGDLIVGGATPTWERLALGASGTFLKSDGSDPNWATLQASDIDTLALLLDQTTPQTVVNGIPLLDKEYDDFSNPDEFVNKGYVDWVATAIGANYYMTDDDDGDTGYKVCSLTPSAGSETYIEASGVTDGQLLGTWISDVGEAPAKLPRGMYDWFIFAEKTSGTKTFRLYWKLYERKTDTSEVLIATSSESNELKMGEKTSYVVPLALDSDYTPDSGSRIVGKIYASVSGGGNAPTVKIYYQGASGSRWEIPSTTEILNNIYIKRDEIGIDDDDILQVDQASGLTAGNLVRATSSGLESRTDAEILAQLSGKASSAFDWNGQDLTGVGDIQVGDDKYIGINGDVRIEFDSTNHYFKILGGDFFTDRWLLSVTNTVFGVGAFGAGNLIHTTGSEGYYNTGIGMNALRSITKGRMNLALGTFALQGITLGVENVAGGHNAFYSNSTGSYNIVLGKDAGYSIQGGNGNVIIGHKAGRGTAAHDKNYNVLIGYLAGQDLNAVDHKLVIANSYTDARTLIHGDFSTKTLFTKAPTSAPVDGDFHASDISFYLDETNHKLKVKVKYSDGTTIKTGEVALS